MDKLHGGGEERGGRGERRREGRREGRGEGDLGEVSHTSYHRRRDSYMYVYYMLCHTHTHTHTHLRHRTTPSEH